MPRPGTCSTNFGSAGRYVRDRGPAEPRRGDATRPPRGSPGPAGGGGPSPEPDGPGEASPGPASDPPLPRWRRPPSALTKMAVGRAGGSLPADPEAVLRRCLPGPAWRRGPVRGRGWRSCWRWAGGSGRRWRPAPSRLREPRPCRIRCGRGWTPCSGRPPWWRSWTCSGEWRARAWAWAWAWAWA